MELLQGVKNLLKNRPRLVFCAAVADFRRKQRSRGRDGAIRPPLQHFLQNGVTAAFGKPSDVLLFDPGANIANNIRQSCPGIDFTKFNFR
jgi:hypothetical protein